MTCAESAGRDPGEATGPAYTLAKHALRAAPMTVIGRIGFGNVDGRWMMTSWNDEIHGECGKVDAHLGWWWGLSRGCWYERSEYKRNPGGVP